MGTKWQVGTFLLRKEKFPTSKENQFVRKVTHMSRLCEDDETLFDDTIDVHKGVKL